MFLKRPNEFWDLGRLYARENNTIYVDKQRDKPLKQITSANNKAINHLCLPLSVINVGIKDTSVQIIEIGPRIYIPVHHTQKRGEERILLGVSSSAPKLESKSCDPYPNIQFNNQNPIQLKIPK